jgi:thymidylate synthase ThyX
MREWRTIFKLRLAKAAHPMIRIVLGQIFDWFDRNVPVLVEDLK